MSRPALSKPGRYGTLYRYAIAYSCGDGDTGRTWRTWAYDADHAADRWHESNWGEWDAIGAPTLVRE